MRHPDTPDCSIKGCTRAAFKGYLCRKHYGMIPLGEPIVGYMAVFGAMFDGLDKLRRKQLAYVRRVLRDSKDRSGVTPSRSRPDLTHP